jgi:hypothetical protein
MYLVLASMLGCLDYGELADSLGDLEEDDRGGDRGDDDDDDDRDDDDRGGNALGGDDDDDRGDDDDDGGNGGPGGGATDETCALGVAAFCTCSGAYDYPCTDADMEAFYASCVSGEDQGLFECMTEFVEDNTVDCYGALTTCLAEYEG